MSETLHYFAYGSNMNPRRVEKRQMAFDAVASGKLHDYRLCFNKKRRDGAASANVMPEANATTEGLIYRLTDPEQIKMMDPYEDYPSHYDRQPLPILTNDGHVSAWVYIACPDYVVKGLLPFRWYLEHMLKGEPWLSKEYVAWLRQTECLLNSATEPS